MSALRDVAAHRRIAALADAAARWSDADFPPRVRVTRALEVRLKYSEPVIDYALDRLFGSLTAAVLTETIERELGGVDVLDGAGPDGWARGVEQVVIVSSDTTIGVAIVPLVFALCAGCTVTVKDRADALVAAFLATVIEECPAVAAAARAAPWTGGTGDLEAALLAAADTVVVFGRDETLRHVRERCAAGATFVPYGHRASVGFLGAGANRSTDVLDGIARDTLLYDGDGCLSLHALYVDDTIDAAGLGDELAAAFERVSIVFPAGPQAPARAAAAAGYRNAAAFRAAGGRGRVFRTADGIGTVVLGAPAGEPPPLVPRTLPVIAVDGLDGAAMAIRTAALPVQALGVSDPGDPAALRLAARIGAVRVARFGSLQDPPASGHHGGRPRIADFVRWIDRA